MNLLLVHLGSVAILALAVELACRLGRFRPAICHALWLVVLVKLMVPPFVAWPVDARALGNLAWEPSPASGVASAPERAPIARGELAGDGALESSRAAAAGEGTGGAEVDMAKRMTLSLGLLWGAGSLLLVGRIGREVLRGRRRVAAAAPLPGWLAEQLETTCKAMGVPAPRAVLTREAGAVYMQIAGRPILVVSEGSLAHVAPANWHTILTHELAYLKRRDQWVAWALLVAGVAWWWNPCFWWVRHRIHLFSEMACDAWVVDTHPEDRRQYAETMVRIMAMLSGQSNPAPALGLSVWSAATQERRLWMIMKATGGSRVPRKYFALVAVLALALAPGWLAVGADESKKDDTAVAASNPEAPVAGASNAASGWVLSLEPTEDVQEKFQQPADITFEGVHVETIVEFLQDSHGVNIVLDSRAVAPAPAGGLPPVFGVPGGPGPKPAEGVVVRPSEAAPVPEAPLGGEPYVTDGMVPYVNLKGTPIGDILKALSRGLGLAVQLRGDVLWVSSEALILADQAVPLPRSESSEGKLPKKMKSKVNVEFEDIHIADMIEFISSSFKLNIVLDDRYIMPAGGDWDAPPAGSSGYVTDGVIRYLNLKNLPMGEFLYIATRQMNLSYRLDGEAVFISTPEVIASGAKPPAE